MPSLKILKYKKQLLLINGFAVLFQIDKCRGNETWFFGYEEIIRDSMLMQYGDIDHLFNKIQIREL